MNPFLRLLGVLVPALAGLIAFGTPIGIATSAEAVEAVTLRFALGLVSGLLIRSWWAVVIVPIVYIGTFWIARAFTCPECTGPTYDVSILGALLYGFTSLIPVILGTALGAVTGRSLEKWLERPSAD